MEINFVFLSQKLGQETLWHTNLQKVHSGKCRGSEVFTAVKIRTGSSHFGILYVREKEKKHLSEPKYQQLSNYVVAVAYFCQSKHIKKSMETLGVRFNLMPVVKTTMNEENA